MTQQPLLSFIVLSYNYENYIGQTIRSILDQTVQDFEIVVVDDASKDTSREVVAAFNDPRIRLLVNERNLGGAGSYNRAVSAAHGEWLVNLDADDWIAPEKSAIQLAALARDPAIDIIGTHIVCVDADGKPHPKRLVVEAYTNHDLDLNRVDTWVGCNAICRSSSIVRRLAHLRIGLDDPNMVRAPDYELWTRALRLGCRFKVVQQPLTFYRMHARGVTHADPLGTVLELSYSMLRNLVPPAEAHALWPTFCAIVLWIAQQQELAILSPGERYRLLGMTLRSAQMPDFLGFGASLRAEVDDDWLAEAGRRCLALIRANPETYKLTSDNKAFVDARDWWHDQSDRWQAQCIEWQERAARTEAALACVGGAGSLGSGSNGSVRLIEAGRKPRWRAANRALAVLSRYFRSS